MDWLQLLALLGEGTGGAFLVRQLFGFTKFVLKRKAVVDVRMMPAATLGEVLAMAEAMRMIDPSPRGRPRGDPAGVTGTPAEWTKPRLLPGNENDDTAVGDNTA
jgi:hypothetical protein